MKININEKNAGKITDALKAVNGKATSFTITSYEMVAACAKDAEKMLEARGVPKNARSGASYIYRPAGPTAKAYRASPISTQIVLQRGAKAWFLVDVSRTTVHPKQKERGTLVVTQHLADIITAHALTNVVVR